MVNTKATKIMGNQRYEAYTDVMGRHFVYDNKLSCTFSRYKTKAQAIKEAREMNSEDGKNS